MFLTFNKATGQPLQVVQASPDEASNYETEEVGSLPLLDGWPDGLSSSYVSPEGILTPIPQAPAEGVWLWDWASHSWNEVVKADSTPTTVAVPQ